MQLGEVRSWWRGVAREHILQALLVVAFAAWSLAVWSTKAVVESYLTTQKRIEERQEHIQNTLSQLNSTLLDERAQRREEILVIRDRQDRNTRMVDEHELRIRNLEVKGDRRHD